MWVENVLIFFYFMASSCNKKRTHTFRFLLFTLSNSVHTFTHFITSRFSEFRASLLKLALNIRFFSLNSSPANFIELLVSFSWILITNSIRYIPSGCFVTFKLKEKFFGVKVVLTKMFDKPEIWRKRIS